MRRALLVFALVLGPAALAACEEEGPAEEVGERIDESAEEGGEAVEEATD